MEWISQLEGQLVALDTAPLIYFIEENPTYLDMMENRLIFSLIPS